MCQRRALIGDAKSMIPYIHQARGEFDECMETCSALCRRLVRVTTKKKGLEGMFIIVVS